MLTILSNLRRTCSGLSRRELLQIGGAGLLGVNLPTIEAAESARRVHKAKAKSVVFLFLFGGPSQLESFDMKPDAPSGVRGPFRPIASRTPELRISEHLPKLAAMSDRYCVIRSMTHRHNDHNACHYIQTGHPMPPAPRGAAGVDATDKDWPAMGSVVEYLNQQSAGKDRSIPSYVYLPNRLGHLQGYDRLGQYGGWLGRAYNALATDIRKRGPGDDPYIRPCTDDDLDFRIKGLAHDPSLTLDRLDGRRSLLDQFESGRRELLSGPSEMHERMRHKALDLIASKSIRAALDIRLEPPRLRDRYGRHLFGQATLMGRRMIEAGARFVSVLWDAPGGYSWDSHINSNDLKNSLLPGLDQALSALLDDMRDRGLLDETLVVCMGEIGRTPQGTAQWGRGHWSFCFPAMLAGAGVRGGLVHGRSDREAGYPIDHPVSPEDLSATIFDTLGIDPAGTIADRQGRPVTIMEGGRPMRELFA
jgi:hypothetical protein